MDQKPKKKPWIVRTHHRMRTISFAMLFVAIGLHIRDQAYGAAAWLLLTLQFLVYPHLQYWRARRARNPVATELNNLLIDSALLGVWIAALGFPLWIAFSAIIGTLFNNAGNRGQRGIVAAALALSGGALAWIALAGLTLAPDTGWPVTLFCIFGLTVYLLTMGNIGFRRNRELRQTRERLQQGERVLLRANEDLKSRLREIDQLQEQLREQANRDALTGLYNRRYLDNTLERELARCKREGLPLALIMIDIDQFKRINDTYGHQAGDEMLRRLGAILGSMARAEDVACRYGGEEFLMLLPKMPLGVALERAEKLRTDFCTLTVPFGEFRLKTTLSIGIAIYPGHGKSADALIQCADRAMYRAKHEGRNRVEVEAVGDEMQTAGSDSGALVKVIWKDRFLSGHRVIDAQHRALFGDANELLSAILAGRPAADVDAMIDALMRDVVRHFQDEEAILGAAAYAGTAAHAALHRALADRAATLVERFRAGAIGLGALFEFLAHDLIAKHMLIEDRLFFPSLRDPH
ncbi:putative diguanylate cyclase AdrA [mine drainage metagenome]|uniref:Putative diguanylate cyclase AdrA n=1 Tax=mine drainage metagenome TaxID=410659 RepID=A0A1J5QTS3_9ZZZZ